VRPNYSFLYAIVVGLFLIFQIGSVVIRIDSILLQKRLASPNSGVEGHIRITNEALYRNASNRFTTLAIFTLCCYLITNEIMLLGGSVGLLASAFRAVRLANHHKKASEESVKEE
jgi:hypothetical protein